MDMWLCGCYGAMWLCGCVAVWLDQKGSKRFTLKEVHSFGCDLAAVPENNEQIFQDRAVDEKTDSLLDLFCFPVGWIPMRRRAPFDNPEPFQNYQ